MTADEFVPDSSFELGDIFWAKVGSHPWWPCMIYYSPEGDCYNKNRGKTFVNHVQFFGPLVERAWVQAACLLPFYDNVVNIMSGIPLTIEEEAESLSTFLREELERRLSADPDLSKSVLENELRTQWTAFDIATKRQYISDKLGIFQASRKSVNLAMKKIRANLEPKCEDHSELPPKKGRGKKSFVDGRKQKGSGVASRYSASCSEFDVEIHRLVASPAAYRPQPVCPACEVYSSLPGRMLLCNGPCHRTVHPDCLRYKMPPPSGRYSLLWSGRAL
ncbi:unnamed protein product [Protopolystoma xenopodis]|uniref:PWWP domain-containing protein n=1 Tax=Protopolystoma xenopodis TaxID=117903 RepID=A0A3S5BY30_9PLAT|nr:unnamed protein product [Protopolystoma xenopodis]